MAGISDGFHDALDYGLKMIEKADISLIFKQYEVLKAVGLSKRDDNLAILPIGYGETDR